jgi:hypothetical protein
VSSARGAFFSVHGVVLRNTMTLMFSRLHFGERGRRRGRGGRNGESAVELTLFSLFAQVILLLPPLSIIRTVAERLKTVSPYITISANNRGELRCVFRFSPFLSPPAFFRTGVTPAEQNALTSLQNAS